MKQTKETPLPLKDIPMPGGIVDDTIAVCPTRGNQYIGRTGAISLSKEMISRA